MVDDGEGADDLDLVLDALANRHRRAMVYAVGLHPHAISQLAQMRQLSLPAIHKHVKVLEGANLIRRVKRGRTTFLILNRHPLQHLQDWAGQFHLYWGSDEATYENYDQFLGIDRTSKTESNAISEGEPPS